VKKEGFSARISKINYTFSICHIAMGLKDLHSRIKEAFPHAICHFNGKVDAILCDTVSQAYTSSTIGSEGHKHQRENQQVGVVDPDDSDEDRRFFDPVMSGQKFPTPAEIAKHIMVDSLSLSVWSPRFAMFFTDRRDVPLLWKARTRALRAKAMTKRMAPYPKDSIHGFTDEGVIGPDGKVDPRFPLRGDQIMMDQTHRQLFMDYLLKWSFKYPWPTGCNYIFRVQGHIEHAILANDEEPFTLGDPTEYAEADYEIPFQIRNLYDLGCRSFIVFSVDSDMILILLAFWELLLAPMGVENGNKGVDIYLFRGKLPKDENKNDRPAYISMRTLAHQIQVANADSSLFTSIAILSHTSDYFEKKWATNYVNMKVGYVYLSAIGSYFSKMGGFRWHDFASVKRLIHCLLHCHAHYTSMSRKLRPKCGWQPKRVKKLSSSANGEVDGGDNENEDGEETGPMLDMFAQDNETKEQVANYQKNASDMQDTAARVDALNSLMREIRGFKIPPFASLQETVEDLMGDGRKRKKNVPNWLKNGLELEQTFTTLISVLDRKDEEKKKAMKDAKEAARKQAIRRLAQTNAFENVEFDGEGDAPAHIKASHFQAASVSFQRDGTARMQVEETETTADQLVVTTEGPNRPDSPATPPSSPGPSVPKPVESVQLYLDSVKTRYIEARMDENTPEVMMIDQTNANGTEQKQMAIVALSPKKKPMERVFDWGQQNMLKLSDATPWEMYFVFNLMIRHLKIMPGNPFAAARLGLRSDDTEKFLRTILDKV
jgi:hypothetical protein